jgi:hypothetical protein
MFLGGGAILVAVVSVALVCLLSSLSWSLRALWVVTVPFALAYLLYWIPVWLEAGPCDLCGAWSILGVGSWFLAGFFPSAIVTLILEKRRAKELKK